MVRHTVLSRRLLKCRREVRKGRQLFFQRYIGTILSLWRAGARVVCETMDGEPQIERSAAAVCGFGTDKLAAKAMFEAELAAGAPEEVRWGP